MPYSLRAGNGHDFQKTHRDRLFSIVTHPAKWHAVKSCVRFCALWVIFPFSYNLSRTKKILNLYLVMTWSTYQRAGAWILPCGHLLLRKWWWWCFREVREVCIFALGKIMCLSYLGLKTTKNAKVLSCFTKSAFEKPALSSTWGWPLHASPVWRKAPGSWLWFYLRQFLFINCFKVKAKRAFSSSHT